MECTSQDKCNKKPRSEKWIANVTARLNVLVDIWMAPLGLSHVQGHTSPWQLSTSKRGCKWNVNMANWSVKLARQSQLKTIDIYSRHCFFSHQGRMPTGNHGLSQTKNPRGTTWISGCNKANVLTPSNWPIVSAEDWRCRRGRCRGCGRLNPAKPHLTFILTLLYIYMYIIVRVTGYVERQGNK